MVSSFADLDTPCVVIDIDRVEANLKRAQAHADANGYTLRPHIKTHKLPRWAKRQVELGAAGITCQKLGEAEVMADAGLTDIFLPYNILGERKLARLKALNARITLSVTADSPDTIAGYAKTFTADAPLTVLVECDTGTKRCGVQTPAQALALARQIADGAGPQVRRPDDLSAVPPARRGRGVAARGRRSADAGRHRGSTRHQRQHARTCGAPTRASSPSAGPGTYIYFDRMQVANGAASWDDCALTVLATVVSRPTANRVVIDAGSKSLSSDLAGADQPGYGLLMGTDARHRAPQRGARRSSRWQTPSDTPRVGDRVRVIPNHVCVVSNLFDVVHLVARRHGRRDASPVAARGRVD